jgi:hypothetical protein
MISKVISGGQNGVDIAGLMAAWATGIETGGNIPWGYKTLDGPRYDLKLLNLKQSDSPFYPPRTEQNVLDSDATLRLALDFNSAGEKCTYKYLIRHNKPYYDIRIYPHLGTFDLHETITVKAWLEGLNVKTLNIAGNSEETAPGITSKAFFFLFKLFKEISCQHYN